MKKYISMAGAALLAPFSLAAALETHCSRPDQSAVPEGAQGTEAQLIDAQELVRDFIAAGDQYRN